MEVSEKKNSPKKIPEIINLDKKEYKRISLESQEFEDSLEKYEKSPERKFIIKKTDNTKKLNLDDLKKL